MKVIGIDGLTPEQVSEDLQRGARFVIFEYCISIVIMTFKRGSDIYFVRPGENRQLKGLGFTLLSLVAGWWGFPWGPIYTIGALITNLSGGKDVTSQVAANLFPPPMPAYAGSGSWPPPPQPPAAPPPNYYSQPPT